MASNKTCATTEIDKPFIKLIRSDHSDVELLIKNAPNAFLLLTQIALRARRVSDECNYTNLKQREAMVGDYTSCGLTERKYRTAKLILQRRGFATFKATSKGTVATLCDSRVYDINAEQGDELNDEQKTSKRRAKDEQETTKKKGKSVNNENNAKNGESASSDTQLLISAKKRKLSGKRLATFLMFWEAFGHKKDRAKTIDAWLDIPHLTDPIVNVICAKAKEYAEARAGIIAKGSTPIWAQGWLNGRRWEDEAIEQATPARPTVESLFANHIPTEK